MFELMPFNRRRNEASLFDYLDNMERSFFGDMTQNLAQFRTDILDRGDHYELQAELPGFEKEDINIDIKDDYLTISAEHSSNDEEKDEKGNYIRRERSFGSYKRSFGISNVEHDGISAEYKNGVLTIELPKKKAEEPVSKRLEIK